MKLVKRLARLLAFLLGCIGFVACVVAIYFVWSYQTRLSQTTEKLFQRIDGGLVVVRDRTTQARDRVQASKIDIQTIEQSLQTWMRRESGQRLASRLDVEDKAARLGLALSQADQWLEVSASSVELVQQALEIGNSAGASINTESLDRLLKEIASLRIELSDATKLVGQVRERIAAEGDAATLEERIDQAMRLALRVVATLGSLDSRLLEFENSLSETRQTVSSVKTKTLGWIQLAAIGCTVLAVWIAAGQAALCLLAWRGLSR